MSDLEMLHAARTAFERPRLVAFLCESLAIEGIHRDPTEQEIAATESFLLLPMIGMSDICDLQAVYVPGKPIRDRIGMNVSVGRHYPPLGGAEIPKALMRFCNRLRGRVEFSPWRAHVEFEALHPFMDGNGRTGRAIWAWHMRKVGQDPFALGFLHRFYYQTLEHVGQ